MGGRDPIGHSFADWIGSFGKVQSSGFISERTKRLNELEFVRENWHVPIHRKHGLIHWEWSDNMKTFF